MTDREQLHQSLNERVPRFAQHLPFDQRDANVQLIQAGPTRAGSTGGAPTAWIGMRKTWRVEAHTLLAMVRDGLTIRPCGKRPTRDGLCYDHHPRGQAPQRKARK